MSLDALLRLRVEPELKEQLERHARAERVAAAQLARRLLWDGLAVLAADDAGRVAVRRDLAGDS